MGIRNQKGAIRHSGSCAGWPMATCDKGVNSGAKTAAQE